MISRRHLMLAAGGAALLSSRAQAKESKAFGESELERAIKALETESKGRLGVSVRDTGSGQRFAWRGDERFPMCSTFKFLLAAAVLARVDKGEEKLERGIAVKASDIIMHSPTAERFVGREASVATLCEATMTLSDNAAANLLLPTIGGPQGLTKFLRETGDTMTRLDRNEPALNVVPPGDVRDTTSPNAMLATLERLALGSVLKPASRAQLTGWLVANRTGDARLRAGLPKGWRVGDKTGTGGEDGRSSNNDIAIVWPPGAAPVLITSYLTECPLKFADANAIHAGVARAITAALAAG